MKQFDYPGLYDGASDLSATSQSQFLKLVKSEYMLLFVAAILGLELSGQPAYYIAYALVLLVSLTVSVGRSWLKPEQSWYKGRALAESVKTSCWRFCMRAEPFGSNDSLQVSKAEFRNHLRAILEANRHIGEKVPSDSAAKDQITASMESTRALSLAERKTFYEEFRIRDQRAWYAKNSGLNRKASRLWSIVAVVTYAIAIGLSLVRISRPELKHWPVEPLIVFASSVIGWTQIKKYNELASSYGLTAHEIGIIQGRVADVTSEAEFSSFVNDAEQAFSREHTQWVARQQSA